MARAATTTTVSNPTTSTVVSPPSTTSTTVALAGAGNQCTAGDLRPSWLGFGDGASEHLFYVVNLENVSGRACVTGGYVGVAAYEPDGLLISASEERAPSMAPDVALSVGPGTSMHFSVGFPDVDIEAGGRSARRWSGPFISSLPTNGRTCKSLLRPLRATRSSAATASSSAHS